MKILFIHDTIDCNGGAEIYVKDQINLLEKHKIEVFSFFIGQIPIIKNNVYFYKEFDIKIFRGLAKIFFDPVLIYTLIKYIKTVKPDLIHLHHTNNYPLSILLSLPKNIPVVKSVYDYSMVCASAWGVNKKTGQDCYCGYSLKSVFSGCLPLFRYIIFFLKYRSLIYLSKNIPKKVFVADKEMEKSIKKAGFKNIEIVPYFVPKLEGNNKYENPTRNSFRLLFIGKLTKEKGVSDLLKAISIIKNITSKFLVDIVGDGPEKRNLINETINLEITGNVKFYDSVSREALHDFYMKSSILVIPSIWKQNLPLVMMEAMSNGLSVLASNTGSSSYIIKPKTNGFLFKARDYNDLASKILYCLENKDLLNKMRETIRLNAAKEFNPKKYFLIIKKYYRIMH